MGSTIAATAVITVFWSLAILLVIGAGVPLGRVLRLGPSTRLATLFWLGLAAVVTWLFLAHLAVPLDSIWVRLPLVAVAVTGWWMLYRFGGLEGLKSNLPRRGSDWIIPLGALTAVLVLANLSLGQPGNYDSYFYHFASIRHYSEYAAIEGLVNLHHRLGFQAATLPLASFLDLWPLSGEGFRQVNGFLGAALIFEVGSRLRRILRTGRVGLGDVVLAVSVPLYLLIPGAASPTGAIASPSLDTGAGILCLVAFAYFVDALAERSGDRVAIALVVLGLAATFRQLNLVVLLFAAPLLLLILWRAGKLNSRTVGISVLVAGLVVISASLHSAVVTGYPFYPATFPSLGLPWAHPADEAAAVREFITQFARGTLGDPVSLTGPLDRTFSWLGEWLAELRQTGQLGRLRLLGTISLLSVIGIVISRNRRTGIRRLALLLVPLIPTVAFWFVTAPLVRFGFGPIALLFTAPVAILLASGRYELEVKGFRQFRPRVFTATAALGLMLLISGLLMAAGKYGKQGTLLVSADGSGALGSREPRPIQVQEVVLEGGVEVYRPTEQTFCGFELWCTIETQFGLKVRGDSFEDGFERLRTKPIEP